MGASASARAPVDMRCLNILAPLIFAYAAEAALDSLCKIDRGSNEALNKGRIEFLSVILAKLPLATRGYFLEVRGILR